MPIRDLVGKDVLSLLKTHISQIKRILVSHYSITIVIIILYTFISSMSSDHQSWDPA